MTDKRLTKIMAERMHKDAIIFEGELTKDVVKDTPSVKPTKAKFAGGNMGAC